MHRVLWRSFYGERAHPHPFAWARPGARPVARARTLRLSRWAVVFILVSGLAGFELRTSRLQSALLSGAAGRLTYSVAPGAGTSIRFPAGGPYDIRAGYAAQPAFVKRLTAHGFAVDAQARWSRPLARLVDAGFFPIYPVKSQVGLAVLDAAGRPLFASRHPRHAYRRFDAIPPLVAASLLYIENRELLQADHPYRNPAVEYDRLAKATFDVAVNRIFTQHPVTGGSTLAVQLEKLRHSPGGRTGSVGEKGRQIVSASLRSYSGGRNTTAARQRIVTDYLDSVPIAAIAGHGEVFGLGDGLHAWYGADVPRVNALLAAPDLHRITAGPLRAETALAYRQVLSLLAAVKKPSVYLSHEGAALDARTDAYLRALASEGIIPAWLRDDALRIRAVPRARVETAAPPAFAERKAVDMVRAGLATQLGLASVHDLDRLDLTVRTTLDGAVNDRVTQTLRGLGTCAGAARAGLLAYRLLEATGCGQVVYSLTLYERTLGGNLLRVQADNYDQPLSINEGTKLELGSTAKLRTLVTYLELVEALHRQYADRPADALRALRVHRRDRLTRWAAAYLAAAPDRSLPIMLEAAMNRTYSASPYEWFFTGGGLHAFANFDGKDDARIATVRDALRQSINLVFIRVMRDVADHLAFRHPETAGVLDDARHPARAAYLARFADWEGRQFLRRFYVQPPHAAGRHPLDAWLQGYRREHPRAELRDAFAASGEARQAAYDWLFRTRHHAAQNRAIDIILERDAFAEIHASWRRQGYPFESLVPSYATAIGSSGDNPAALAELMGIIVNDGVRRAAFRIDELHFAAGTPYETRVTRRAVSGRRVLSRDVASLLRRELVGVVEQGTGRRLAGGVTLPDGRTLAIGGKTGTGDNRFETATSSRVVSRTAAFTFTIGDRFFGSMVAYVPGDAAAAYGFTSALPVQIVKHLLPVLAPVLGGDATSRSTR